MQITKRYRPGLLHWEPRPLPRPQITPQFQQLSLVSRTAMAIRYGFDRFEYSLSPNGVLREWAKLNVRLALCLALPLLLPLPLATMVLAVVLSWTKLILAICVNVLLIVIILLVLGLILSVVAAHRKSRHRRS